MHHLRRPPRRYSLGIAGANSLGPFGARSRIARAIKQFAPDLIIPCDDYAGQILHRIGASAPSRMRHLVESSLGPVENYSVLENRSAQVELAHRRNIRTPRFTSVEDEASLPQALHKVGLPAFAKRDDSWAGQGVRKIDDRSDAYRVWRDLSKQHSWQYALENIRTLGVRHALAGIRRARPSIQLQGAVAGRPANRTVLCRDGEVLAGFSVVALETTSGTGPASVVRVIDNAEMSAAAEVLARELRLNGLAGFDFILGEKAEAHFLEINARATPSANLSFAGAPDLLALLFRTMTDSVDVTDRSVATDTIALFPDEMLRDEASPFLATAYHDIPTDEPGLVRFGLELLQAKGEAMPSASRTADALAG